MTHTPPIRLSEGPFVWWAAASCHTPFLARVQWHQAVSLGLASMIWTATRLPAAAFSLFFLFFFLAREISTSRRIAPLEPERSSLLPLSPHST